ncbi:hypothetical protein P154DRAFT_270037 [Amniculicola lignicola CBS 123094]|uniref:Integral membrane protein-like protein n=1 Tax=Amniculicola lignicola CBS 123094 TaxID=1392246 RepID=A0A6A5W7J9_9PLEO|nr:hypothetical protein P154DRAFT_270037 [Amniculicola lignicola CBS 123094]
MPSDLVSQTAQGAVLSMTSNVLAQFITAYKNETSFGLSLEPILEFAIFSVISNPPNIVWQTFLEDMYPTNVPVREPAGAETEKAIANGKANGKPTFTSTAVKTELSKRNLLIKFALDQTIGAVVNTLLFLTFMGYMNALNNHTPVLLGAQEAIMTEIKSKFFPMIKDGYKFWPFVSLVSFLWVPVERRVVFGCLVGVGWGVYLSLMV